MTLDSLIFTKTQIPAILKQIIKYLGKHSNILTLFPELMLEDSDIETVAFIEQTRLGDNWLMPNIQNFIYVKLCSTIILYIFFQTMNFSKLEAWAIPPQNPSNNLRVGQLVVPKTVYFAPRQIQTINLGLRLDSVPNNTIVKIENMIPNCKILDTFWLATSHVLTLTLIAENYAILYRGTVLCKIYLLPAECLVPGIYLQVPIFFNF